MAMMSARGFRHLPVLDAGKVVGVISMGDVVKDIIRNLEHNVGDLIGYIMTDGPGG
jgi:CBS domain-containing protein